MDMQSGNMASSFAMIATTYLMQKLGLNMMYYGILFPLLIGCYNNFNTNMESVSSFVNNWYTIAALIILGIGYLLKLYGHKFNFENSKDKMYISIIDPDKLRIFKDYIALNNRMFINKRNIKFGDLDIMHMHSVANYNGTSWGRNSLQHYVTGELGETNDFNDTNFDVYGKIVWKKFIKKVDSNEESKKNQVVTDWVYIYPNIIIDEKRSKCDFMEYYSKIEKYLREYNKNNISLDYLKVLGSKEEKQNVENHHCVNFYKGPLQTLEEKEKIFIDSFFHMKKDIIWNTLKKVHYEPDFFHSFGQNPRMNILLYGPPGSGKSSFVYRIARCLDRHIVSLDINTITSKKELYKLIQKPFINQYCYTPREVIIVLEEFDIAVKKLHKAEKKAEKKKSFTRDDYYLPKSEDSAIVMPIFSNDNDKIYLRDLLDILQGTIPIDGSIIMATSNKYEEIKDFCPELFRSGRMTPIYFGYLDEDNFKNVCKYYFGLDPKQSLCDIMFSKEFTIKTSSIIEKALETKLSYSNSVAFAKFEDYLESMFV